MNHKNSLKLLSLLLPLAICCSPTAMAGPSIPPSDPPICTIDPGIFSLCEIDLVYSLANCGDDDNLPQGQDGGTSSPSYASTCGYIALPIVPYIQCRTVNDKMSCEGYPTSTPALAYSWTVSGPLRVHQAATDMQENDRLIELSCTVVEGIGSLGLTIVNPHSGVSSTTTVPVKCTSNGNSIARLK